MIKWFLPLKERERRKTGKRREEREKKGTARRSEGVRGSCSKVLGINTPVVDLRFNHLKTRKNARLYAPMFII